MYKKNEVSKRLLVLTTVDPGPENEFLLTHFHTATVGRPVLPR